MPESTKMLFHPGPDTAAKRTERFFVLWEYASVGFLLGLLYLEYYLALVLVNRILSIEPLSVGLMDK